MSKVKTSVYDETTLEPTNIQLPSSKGTGFQRPALADISNRRRTRSATAYEREQDVSTENKSQKIRESYVESNDQRNMAANEITKNPVALSSHKRKRLSENNTKESYDKANQIEVNTDLTISEFRERQSPNHTFTDIMEKSHHNLILAPFDKSKYTSGISIYDTPSKGKVLEAPEYVTDIFQRLYNAETKHLVHPYLCKPSKINAAMRSILVDWLVEVHMKFRLEQETLYLCVNILDRFLSAVTVERKSLQLVGVTALLLASKYEEIYPPEVNDCVYITDRTYNRQEILDMEANILAELKFNLTVPSAFPFLQRFLFITQATTTMRFASSFYLDRMLQEHDVLKFRPSLLAAAVVCLAINHPGIREFDDVDESKPGLPQVLLEYTGFAPVSILEAAAFVASKVKATIQKVSNRSLVGVKRKYEEARYNFISSDFELPSILDITD